MCYHSHLEKNGILRLEIKSEYKENISWNTTDTVVQGSSRKKGEQVALTTTSSSWQTFSTWDTCQCLTSHNRWEKSVSVATQGEGLQLNHCFQGTPKGAAHLPDSRKIPTQRNDPFFKSPFPKQAGETMKTPSNSFSDSWAGIKTSTNNWENDNVRSKYCWGKKTLLRYSASEGTAGQAIQSMLAAFPRRLILLGSVYNKAQWEGQLQAEPHFGKATQLPGQPGQWAGNYQYKSSPLCSDSPTCDKENRDQE